MDEIGLRFGGCFFFQCFIHMLGEIVASALCQDRRHLSKHAVKASSLSELYPPAEAPRNKCKEEVAAFSNLPPPEPKLLRKGPASDIS